MSQMKMPGVLLMSIADDLYDDLYDDFDDDLNDGLYDEPDNASALTVTPEIVLPQAYSRRGFLLRAAGLAVAGFAATAILPDTALAARKAARPGNLQVQVNSHIKRMRRAGLVARDEKTSWSVYDFTTQKKLVAIREDVPHQGASMIKPFIAQAYFYRHSENRRRYPYNAQIKRLMTLMIRNSSNSATNEFIDRIGRSKARQRPREVEALLKRKAGGIFQQTKIVEYIPKSGRSYRNKASAHDYSRFLYALWYNQLPHAEEIKYYMRLPNNDRIVTGAQGLSPRVRIYDKTGSTARLCGDMGIVVAPGRDGRFYPYTFVGIIEKSRRARPYSRWIKDRGDIIRSVSSLVYRHMKQQHGLL